MSARHCVRVWIKFALFGSGQINREFGNGEGAYRTGCKGMCAGVRYGDVLAAVIYRFRIVAKEANNIEL